jgi:hypothetical protein
MPVIVTTNDLYEKLFICDNNNKNLIIKICIKNDPFVHFQKQNSNNCLGFIHFSNSFVCTRAYQELLINSINVKRPLEYVKPYSNDLLIYSSNHPPYNLINFF